MSKVKTTLNIKTEILKDFDLLAKAKGYTRSAMFTTVLNEVIENNKSLIESIKQKNEKEKIKNNTEKLHENLMLKENW